MAITIGLGAVVLIGTQKIQSDLTKSIIGHVVSILAGGNVVVLTCAFLGQVFIVLSTIDSFLHALAISFVRNIKPFCDNKKIKLNQVLCARIATFFIGLASIYYGYLIIQERFSTLQTIGFYGTIFIANMILIPMVAGIVGLKTDKKAFWAFVTVFTLTATSLVLGAGIEKGAKGIYEGVYRFFFTSIGLASLTYLLVHLFINKGIVFVERDTKFTKASKLS
jgi:hypothetical protein